MLITVLPRPALRPWVKTLWLAIPESELRPATGAREHVLPTGDMHLVFRLGGAPLRLFNGVGDACGYTVGHAVVGGARSAFYVRDVVRQSGYSHRHFIALFRRSVGLPPTLYRRILRLQKVLRRVAADASIAWIDLALDCGYSDQAHFSREFREFTGVTPETYRRISPVFAHHIVMNPIIQQRG
ncbi:MAG: helix-turn-helix domain-containing protein [Verrucomicrobiota bacterium]